MVLFRIAPNQSPAELSQATGVHNEFQYPPGVEMETLQVTIGWAEERQAMLEQAQFKPSAHPHPHLRICIL